MSNYVKMYAEQFNLEIKELNGRIDKKFYEGNKLVSYIKKNEPDLFHYRYRKGWHACKVSDLALLILNNTTAHG